MSEETEGLTREEALSLADAWRCIRDSLQGAYPTNVTGDSGHYERMIGALRAVAAKLLLDNIAGASGFDPDDSALLFEAAAFADESVTDAELAALNGGVLPPQAPRPPGSGQAPPG